VKKRCLILFSASCLCGLLSAQEQPQGTESDSLKKARAVNKSIYSSPRKASIMSAIIPGLGQAYNRRYWKIPLIYAGLGGFGYMFQVNNDNYNFYRRNLIAEYDNDTLTKNRTYYSGEQLKSQKLYYRKNRDLAAIGVVVIYLLNIIDANVDAHLRTFDVSDDLSLGIEPWVPVTTSLGFTAGATLRLRF